MILRVYNPTTTNWNGRIFSDIDLDEMHECIMIENARKKKIELKNGSFEANVPSWCYHTVALILIPGPNNMKARAPTRIDLAGGWTDVLFTHLDLEEKLSTSQLTSTRPLVTTDEDGCLVSNQRSSTPLGGGLGTTGAINVAMIGAIDGGKSEPLEIAKMLSNSR